MADDLCDETTIPRAREIARTALEAVNFSTEEGIVDLIADLMHLADEVNPGHPTDLRDGYRPGYDVIFNARSHYEAELPDFPPVLALPTPEQMRDQLLLDAQQLEYNPDSLEQQHIITIDGLGEPRDDDTAYCAFCSCGWKEDHWHHVDSEEYPLTAADEAGQDHLDEMRTS